MCVSVCERENERERVRERIVDEEKRRAFDKSDAKEGRKEKIYEYLQL